MHLVHIALLHPPKPSTDSQLTAGADNIDFSIIQCFGGKKKSGAGAGTKKVPLVWCPKIRIIQCPVVKKM